MLRDGDFGEDAGDDLVGGHFLGLGLVGELDAVAEDVGGDLLDVLGRGVGAAAEHGVGAGGEVEPERRARGGAERDERGEVLHAEARGLAGGEDEVEEVLADLLVAVHRVEGGAEAVEGAGVEDGLDRRFLQAGEARHDLALLLAGGKADDALEHEAVDLRFGERVGALLLDGVLRG